MFISSVILNNFRSYKGVNKVDFTQGSRNVFLIAGNNGFGKTTFLTSLVWCLYGKLIVDVDDKYRREINDAQGYKNFAKLNLNKLAYAEIASDNLSDLKKKISKEGYVNEFSSLISNTQYSVEIDLIDVFIPSIPCRTISIKRTYDVLLETESVDVLIDGQPNKLAKEVGYDIFINDFILSKEIAKFFFFDAEKIVDLVEVKNIEEKRRLSTAYSEVLGIKKYEDIKHSLENLRVKFRKNAGSKFSSAKLEKLTNDVKELEYSISSLEKQRIEKDSLVDSIQSQKDELQEKLIRQGNAMSVEELNKKRQLYDSLKQKYEVLKVKLRDMLDLAPFAISGKLFFDLKKQIDLEQKVKSQEANSEAINKSLEAMHLRLLNGLKSQKMPAKQLEILENLLEEALHESLIKQENEPTNDTCILLDFDKSEVLDFQALYDNIRYSFSNLFKQLVKDVKNTNNFLVKTQKIIAQAEYEDKDTDIKELRAQKERVESQLSDLDKDIRSISEQIGVFSKDLVVKKKQLSEIIKSMQVDEVDREKDGIAERLITELTTFLHNLKLRRKSSLEEKIKNEISLLMHKADFISDVRIDLLDSLIEVNLLDNNGQIITKDKLSKGEQQLYATSILKALVEESGIDFPVFIDSPLQKFDSIHSRNIITKFYPSVSKQVVIFPLLGKELSFDEYSDLLPNVNRSYYIQNFQGVSKLKEVNPSELFNTIAL